MRTRRTIRPVAALALAAVGAVLQVPRAVPSEQHGDGGKALGAQRLDRRGDDVLRRAAAATAGWRGVWIVR